MLLTVGKSKAEYSGDSPATWASPDLDYLGNGRRDAPSFPLDVLGPFWADRVSWWADAACAPPDFVAAGLLTVTGAAIANVRWPRAGADWSEPPLLWTALVGSPGSGKSPALDPVFKLLTHVETKLQEGFKSALAEYEAAKLVAQERRATWHALSRTAIRDGSQPEPLPSDARV